MQYMLMYAFYLLMHLQLFLFSLVIYTSRLFCTDRKITLLLPHFSFTAFWTEVIMLVHYPMNRLVVKIS